MLNLAQLNTNGRYDVQYVERVAGLFITSLQDVVEVRGIGYKATTSGYFNCPRQLARAVASIDGRCSAVWIVPNPVERDCLARANNQLKHFAKITTKDDEVIERRWMCLDFDPVRPAGVSATDDEVRLALEAGEACAEWLELSGWGVPLRAMSGNGGHWLYRLPGLPNTRETDKMIGDIYDVLAERFSTDAVEFDVKLKNAARCIKLYGTMARKGDNTPSLGRIHRRSYIELGE